MLLSSCALEMGCVKGVPCVSAMLAIASVRLCKRVSNVHDFNVALDGDPESRETGGQDAGGEHLERVGAARRMRIRKSWSFASTRAAQRRVQIRLLSCKGELAEPRGT
jgi:hypothetical protein